MRVTIPVRPINPRRAGVATIAPPTAYGDQAANVADMRSRLLVTCNTHYANTLHAGSELDWFWATDTQDHLNAKQTDLARLRLFV